MFPRKRHQMRNLCDLPCLLAKRVLSQLSYTPTYNHLILMDFSEDDHLLPVTGAFANLSYTPVRCNHYPPNSVRRPLQLFQPRFSVHAVRRERFRSEVRSPKPIRSGFSRKTNNVGVHSNDTSEGWRPPFSYPSLFRCAGRGAAT